MTEVDNIAHTIERLRSICTVVFDDMGDDWYIMYICRFNRYLCMSNTGALLIAQTHHDGHVSFDEYVRSGREG